jgi:NTE family protein
MNSPQQAASKLGIALGGGGARGFLHAGVLAALLEDGDPRLVPQYVTGTSIGSIVAALYAAGVPPRRMLDLGGEVNWLENVVAKVATARRALGDVAARALPFRPRRPGRAGFLSSDALGEWVMAASGCRSLDELKLPFAAVATEVRRCERVLLCAAAHADRLRAAPRATPSVPTRVVVPESLGLAVRASAAVPTVFEVVETQGLTLVDGGFAEQVPVAACRALGAEVVVGVSLGIVEVLSEIDLPHHPLANAFHVGMRAAIDGSLALADVAIEPPGIERTSVVDLRAAPRLFEQGFAAMKERTDELRRRLDGRFTTTATGRGAW